MLFGKIKYLTWLEGEITYAQPIFNSVNVEVSKWINNLTPQFTEHMITYQCWDQINPC